MMKFKDRVKICKHERLSIKYHRFGSCSSANCTWNEVRCVDCGAYLTSCSCGVCNSIDGWSSTRRASIQKKIQNMKHWDKLNVIIKSLEKNKNDSNRSKQKWKLKNPKNIEHI